MPRKPKAPQEPSQQSIQLSPEEIQVVLAARKQTQAPAQSHNSSVDVLAEALIKAINITKPKEKLTAANRKVKTPWTPTDGSPKIKLKRKVHQHGIPLDPDFLSNEEIALMNQLRPGLYCDGWVKVIRRKDRGLNIEYPVKTAAQRLKLTSTYGARNLKELLERLITEAANPKTRDEVDADGDYL